MAGLTPADLSKSGREYRIDVILDKIKNKKMDLTEVVRHVKNSSEYLSQRFKIN